MITVVPFQPDRQIESNVASLFARHKWLNAFRMYPERSDVRPGSQASGLVCVLAHIK